MATRPTPRRAGVSSFGIGGTNAHLILEEAPPTPASDAPGPWQLLTLAAKTETALEAATDNLRNHLTRHPELNLADAAYTLRLGRAAFGYRRIAVCRDVADAAAVLGGADPQRVFTCLGRSGGRPVVFMFPGGGAQYVNMGAELYRNEPV